METLAQAYSPSEALPQLGRKFKRSVPEISSLSSTCAKHFYMYENKLETEKSIVELYKWEQQGNACCAAGTFKDKAPASGKFRSIA